MLVIPLDNRFVRQRLSIALGRRRYVLRVYWEERPAAWRLDLLTGDDEPIVIGRRIEPNGWPLRGLVDDRTPDGAIFAWDADDSGAEIGPTEMGTRIRLVFASTSEVADIFERLTGTRPTTAAAGGGAQSGGLESPGGSLVPG